VDQGGGQTVPVAFGPAARRAGPFCAHTDRRAAAGVLPALIGVVGRETANASVTRACRALIAVLSLSRAVISSMGSASVPVMSSAASIAMNATAC
jgi:hypothetical protein